MPRTSGITELRNSTLFSPLLYFFPYSLPPSFLSSSSPLFLSPHTFHCNPHSISSQLLFVLSSFSPVTVSSINQESWQQTAPSYSNTAQKSQATDHLHLLYRKTKVEKSDWPSSGHVSPPAQLLRLRWILCQGCPPPPRPLHNHIIR